MYDVIEKYVGIGMRVDKLCSYVIMKYKHKSSDIVFDTQFVPMIFSLRARISRNEYLLIKV